MRHCPKLIQHYPCNVTAPLKRAPKFYLYRYGSDPIQTSNILFQLVSVLELPLNIRFRSLTACRVGLKSAAHSGMSGRVAQRESTVFTRRGSLVQSQPRPPSKPRGKPWGFARIQCRHSVTWTQTDMGCWQPAAAQNQAVLQFGAEIGQHFALE